MLSTCDLKLAAGTVFKLGNRDLGPFFIPLSRNINMHIFLTVLHILLMVLAGTLCLHNKTSFLKFADHFHYQNAANDFVETNLRQNLLTACCLEQ